MKTPDTSRGAVEARAAEAIREKEAIQERLALTQKASEEATFSGFLRREIQAQRAISIDGLITATGLNKDQLFEFLRGGELSTNQVDLIIACLGLTMSRAN